MVDFVRTVGKQHFDGSVDSVRWACQTDRELALEALQEVPAQLNANHCWVPTNSQPDSKGRYWVSTPGVQRIGQMKEVALWTRGVVVQDPDKIRSICKDSLCFNPDHLEIHK